MKKYFYITILLVVALLTACIKQPEEVVYDSNLQIVSQGLTDEQVLEQIEKGLKKYKTLSAHCITVVQYSTVPEDGFITVSDNAIYTNVQNADVTLSQDRIEVYNLKTLKENRPITMTNCVNDFEALERSKSYKYLGDKIYGETVSDDIITRYFYDNGEVKSYEADKQAFKSMNYFPDLNSIEDITIKKSRKYYCVDGYKHSPDNGAILHILLVVSRKDYTPTTTKVTLTNPEFLDVDNGYAYVQYETLQWWYKDFNRDFRVNIDTSNDYSVEVTPVEGNRRYTTSANDAYTIISDKFEYNGDFASVFIDIAEDDLGLYNLEPSDIDNIEVIGIVDNNTEEPIVYESEKRGLSFKTDVIKVTDTDFYLAYIRSNNNGSLDIRKESE